MTNIVEATDLSKSYNGNVVVDRLNLKIPGQQIFGLLGPNGAGKTTTILMLLGLTEPTGGSIRLGGFDPVSEPLKVKRITGYMPEKLGFYDGLTAHQNLDLIAEFNGIGTAEAREISLDLLQKVGLAEVADKPPGWEITFSPDGADTLAAQETLMVDATITPPDKAISGDYMITLETKSQQVFGSNVKVRISVETRAVWGWVGIIIIVLVVVALGYFIMRFSRR
jgi:ABC-2 type transport system ATP-binding protein